MSKVRWMKYNNLIKHIKQRLAALEREQNALEKKRNQLQVKFSSENEGEITANIEEIKLAIWESQGMQKAYSEILEYLASPPIFRIVEPEKSNSQKSSALCPKCSGEMTATTTIEPAPQPGYVIIFTQYECHVCGHHKREQVCLPKEIALQEHNLGQLMEGV